MDYPFPRPPQTNPPRASFDDYRKSQSLISEQLEAPPATQDVVEKQGQLARDSWKLGQNHSAKVGG
jgi:hypothetical protein